MRLFSYPVKQIVQRAKYINSIISQAITYQIDSVRYGCLDMWQLPSETVALRTGDCEDTSILLSHFLTEENIPHRIVIGYVENYSDFFFTQRNGHMWIEIDINNVPIVLETTNGEIYRRPNNYIPQKFTSYHEVIQSIRRSRYFGNYCR